MPHTRGFIAIVVVVIGQLGAVEQALIKHYLITLIEMANYTFVSLHTGSVDSWIDKNRSLSVA